MNPSDGGARGQTVSEGLAENSAGDSHGTGTTASSRRRPTDAESEASAGGGQMDRHPPIHLSPDLCRVCVILLLGLETAQVGGLL